MLPLQEITERIIGIAMEIHRALGAGFLEQVYHNALCQELTREGITFESKPKLEVFYKGDVVGHFEPDIIVGTGKRLIIELMAVEAIMSAHEAQCVNYLTATNIDDGLILSFGGLKLQVKRKFRLYRKVEFRPVPDGVFTPDAERR